MRNKHINTTAICCMGVVILIGTLALAQEGVSQWPLHDRGMETLKELKKGKVRAHNELTAMRRRLVRQIALDLRAQSGRFSDKYEGESHLLIRIAAEWRIGEVVHVLSKHVGFRLDPKSLPPFAKFDDSTTFAVAEALVTIGDISVVKAMVRNVRDAEEADTIAMSTWVLVRVCGQDMARELLSIERNRSADARGKQRIAGAIELTNASDSIPSDIAKRTH